MLSTLLASRQGPDPEQLFEIDATAPLTVNPCTCNGTATTDHCCDEYESDSDVGVVAVLYEVVSVLFDPPIWVWFVPNEFPAPTSPANAAYITLPDTFVALTLASVPVPVFV
jgi:hypothetical protein